MVPVLTAPLARVSTAPTYTYNSTPLRAPIPVLSTVKPLHNAKRQLPMPTQVPSTPHRPTRTLPAQLRVGFLVLVLSETAMPLLRAAQASVALSAGGFTAGVKRGSSVASEMRVWMVKELEMYRHLGFARSQAMSLTVHNRVKVTQVGCHRSPVLSKTMTAPNRRQRISSGETTGAMLQTAHCHLTGWHSARMEKGES